MEPISINPNSKLLVINGKSVEFEGEISAAAYCRESKVYLAILATNEESLTEKVVGLDEAGTLLFELNLPNEWEFYYFSSHSQFPLAMVCTSPNERFDWYWGIEPKLGSLISLNRAY